MSSFTIIRIVARFEIKTLLRSWFFRIFSMLAVFILVLFNIGVLAGSGSGNWIFRSIPSSVPYVNLLLLNVIQAVIAVFLASDFLKRDSKLDTTEVIYIRSMTNGVYVLGKTLGILVVFLGLNIFILLIACLINVFVPDVSFDIIPYLWYLLLISIPTLVFIFGLSFLFMIIIRNQAVTFIILLGYIASTLFFLSGKLHHVFDYMAFTVPMLYSDFVDFGNINGILIHRGIYFFLGLGFIFTTILFLRRLPQSRIMTRFSVVFSFLFIVTGLILGNVYLNQIFSKKELRQEMIELNNEWVTKPVVTVSRNEINLVHKEDAIEATVQLFLMNNTNETIDRFYFSLNPGLNVTSVKSGQKELFFDREIHLLIIDPLQPLSPQSLDSLTIKYAGRIDENICYLDVDDAIIEERHKSNLLTIDKRYAFIRPDYVLITPETYWYPVPGIAYSSDQPLIHNQQFTRFILNVTTEGNLTAISQGKATKKTEGRFQFITEKPIPQLSLIIGDYHKRSLVIDSVDYQLFVMKNHDYFTEYFLELVDTLPVLIRGLKQDYENNLNLLYHYPRFTLVEVPVQFASYQRLWTVGRETTQPEMVLLPEKGSLIGADFKRMKRMNERRIERFNEVISPEEMQAGMFSRFVNSTFAAGISGIEFGLMSSGQQQLPSIIVNSNYSLYPNYFTYVYYIKSDEWPVFNVALESFLNKGTENTMMAMFRGFTGLSDEEKTNQALQGKDLSDLIAEEEDISLAYNAIKSKGNYLFNLIQSKLDSEEFINFLYQILEENKFRTLSFDRFKESLQQKFKLDLIPYIETWYNSSELPGILVSDIEGYQVIDNNRSVYQVKFKVSNPEPGDGLVVVSFRTFGGGGPGGGGRGGTGGFGFPGPGFADSDLERVIHIPANQTKEVGVILDAAPRLMTTNTLVSKNIPSTLSHMFGTFELDKNAESFEGERLLESYSGTSEPGVIIVDNEDPGFRIFQSGSESGLKKLLNISSDENKEKYGAFRQYRPPLNWQATTNSAFYGKYIRSAYYTKTSTGDNIVVWTAEITDGGYYEIYYYVPELRMRGRGGRTPGQGGGQGPGQRQLQGQQEINDEYHFTIYHDDGEDEVILEMNNVEFGWNHLGSFYLSPDSAKVELSNESPGRVVIADAVKWVRQ
jgi:hypothetical protein